jgi:hypothetical protein
MEIGNLKRIHPLSALTAIVSLCGLLAIVGLFSGCEGRKSKEDRANRAAGAAVTGTSAQVRNQLQEAQASALQMNFKAQWEEVQVPFVENQMVNVASSFSVNGVFYQVITTHSALGSSSLSQFTGDFELSNDGTSVFVSAKCSDRECTKYAMSYEFYKGDADITQFDGLGELCR